MRKSPGHAHSPLCPTDTFNKLLTLYFDTQTYAYNIEERLVLSIHVDTTTRHVIQNRKLVRLTPLQNTKHLFATHMLTIQGALQA